MTHYCAAGNQPRLRAQEINLANGTIDFDFVDATNLSSPDAPHVNGVQIHWLDTDHITLQFRFQSGDRQSLETLDLKRAASAAR